MRKRVLWTVVTGIGLVLFGAVCDPVERLIWNRTDSAPKGFYWLSNAPFTNGRWGVVSASSPDAQWAEARGFVGADWPLIKKIVGVSGDEICRTEQTILINRKPVAQARLVDSQGRNLPDWQGCSRLRTGELFLLNAHADSLDGRYFGPTQITDMDGVAIPLITSHK